MSVVIPARNARRELPRQLEALTNQTWDGAWEVVVVDNGSSDGTAAAALAFGDQLPQLRVLEAAGPSGPGRARNVGARAARGDLLVFVDADDEAAPGYLGAMASALDEHALAGGRMEYRRLNADAMVTARPVAQTENVGSPFGFLPASGGGALGIRKSLFEQVGGFCDDIESGEDIDLCWKAQLAGATLAFVPDAVVHVRLRSGARDVFRQGRSYGEAGPVLYRRYRDRGMPRRSPRSAARFWLGILPRLIRVRSRAELYGVAFLLGVRAGLVLGCVRQRVVYL